MRLQRIAAMSLAVLALAATSLWAAAPPTTDVGESIYLRGTLGSGAELEGSRAGGGVSTRGPDAACVNCHQHSGLGSKEGNISIPPITGEYLFHPRGHDRDGPVLPYVETMHGNRDPYTEVTLARSIREGVDPQGQPLNELMPRFALNDSDMAALIAYLKKLAVRQVPGVSDTVLRFATIFTPDADPVKRRGVLDVLQHYFAEKNSFPFGPSPRMWTSGKTEYSKSMYMANRRWQLEVWDLTGPASTWRTQLEQHLRDEPVFAVLSGLGGSNWEPVHEFCEHNAVPCLFPNVEVPVVADHDFYVLYFSRGVLLEAQLIASKILDSGARQSAVVEQVYRRGDSGEPAAHALAMALKSHGITVHDRELAAEGSPRAVASVVKEAARKADTLVLWLRPADVEGLSAVPPAGGTVYLSGLMSGLEDSPLPPSWREHTYMAYPFDLPDKRGVRLDYPLGWFSFRHIPVVAQQVQVDTYLACSLLAEVLKSMADSFVRAYLIEQLQGMLEHRLITGYYPHLTLAVNQRFASKGGYLAHFSDTRGTRLVADGSWTVP
jgi:hypothetical protein